MKVDYYAGAYLGYQFVVDIENGLCQQIPLIILQAFSKPEDLAISVSTILCESDPRPLQLSLINEPRCLTQNINYNSHMMEEKHRC